MGLKGFHILFILASAVLCLGIASWRADAFIQGGGTTALVHALAWAAAGVGLVVYEIGFVRKSRELSLS
jgi:hypothetical protein